MNSIKTYIIIIIKEYGPNFINKLANWRLYMAIQRLTIPKESKMLIIILKKIIELDRKKIFFLDSPII